MNILSVIYSVYRLLSWHVVTRIEILSFSSRYQRVHHEVSWLFLMGCRHPTVIRAIYYALFVVVTLLSHAYEVHVVNLSMSYATRVCVVFASGFEIDSNLKKS